MSKVITFSRTFPAHHPKAGQPTHFVEKFVRSFCTEEDLLGRTDNEYFDRYCEYADDLQLSGLIFPPKHHTIRAGKRWKVGDKFSPRVWSGKPYNSKQIIIAPDIEIVKVWDFNLHAHTGHVHIEINGREWLTSSGDDFESIMINDGLTPEDFKSWFVRDPKFNKNGKKFSGQILCWNKDINY